MTDDEFLALFEAHQLEEFTHEDHLRMAFAYACRGGVDAAVEGARRIRGFAKDLGAPGKYHDTLTVGWARVVAHFAVNDGESNFDEFLAGHPELRSRTLLSAHYSDELLWGPDARREFVEPDLAPLP